MTVLLVSDLRDDNSEDRRYFSDSFPHVRDHLSQPNDPRQRQICWTDRYDKRVGRYQRNSRQHGGRRGTVVSITSYRGAPENVDWRVD